MLEKLPLFEADDVDGQPLGAGEIKRAAPAVLLLLRGFA
jgi:hypothetical protein